MTEDVMTHGIIANPITHREVYYTTQRVSWLLQKMRAAREGYTYIDTVFETNIPHDLWVCDFCNMTIPVGNKDKQEKVNLLVSTYNVEELKKQANDGEVIGGNALCDSCFNEYKIKYPLIDKVICGCCRSPELNQIGEQQL